MLIYTQQLSLPTLAPTSFPSLLSLLSLRSELGAVTSTWSSARKSIECLEFVRRRWRAKVRAEEVTGDIVEDEDDGMLCPICFESVQTPTQACMQEAIEDCCTLDCSHRLHSVSIESVATFEHSAECVRTTFFLDLSCAVVDQASVLSVLSCNTSRNTATYASRRRWPAG